MFDFAQTRVGHWVEDAVYLEHLYWSRRGRLDGRKLVKQIAVQRKERGLEVDRDWVMFANVQRALLAMSTPVVICHSGDTQHLAAALEVLDRAVG